MAKKTRFGTTSTRGDVIHRKNRRYNRKHRNPRAARQRLMREVFGIDVDDMTMDVGGDIDIEEILAKITPPDNERRANVNRQARLAKVAQALAPPPERIPPQKGVSLPRVSRDERAASTTAEGFDPRTEAFRRLAERGGLSSSQRIPGELLLEAVPEGPIGMPRGTMDIEDERVDRSDSWTDKIQEIIEQIKSQVGKYPPESEKRIADAQRAYDEQTKRMKDLAGTRDSLMDIEDKRVDMPGKFRDSQMDEPVMDYDTDIVMSPDDLEVDSDFEISPGHRGATTVVSQMMDIEDQRVDRTTDETKSSPGLHRKHQQDDSGSRVSVDPVKKMEESWYDAEGNKTNRLGRTIDNFIRGMFGGEEYPGETSPFGILSKASMEGYEDKPWFAEGGVVRKKYRKGGSVKFNSGGTIGWGKAIKGHNTNRDICKKCPI